jgi:ribose 5-phosphate isomerase B
LVAAHLTNKQIAVTDFGTDSEQSCDYPGYAEKVAEAVISGQVQKGILVCGSGIGISIAANKVPGIRCALCHDHYTAMMCRAHNDANILALGGRTTGTEVALEIVDTFLTTAFESAHPNHSRRIAQIAAIEAKYRQAKP